MYTAMNSSCIFENLWPAKSIDRQKAMAKIRKEAKLPPIQHGR
jgi:hypothetical protein